MAIAGNTKKPIEYDEMWSFVNSKKNDVYIWLAIERLNNTFRQRVSRLVRESLSFSKQLRDRIGAI